MCTTDGNDHEHADDHACGGGADFERNLAEQRALGLTRRRALQALGASGLLIAANGGISAGNVFAAAAARPAPLHLQDDANDPFAGLMFLSGDHHIHTRYSSDAKYAVQRQVAEANYHGLSWMVITDHGSADHNRISVDLTYPDIQRARTSFSNMLVFVGLEMNIPGGEHGTVMIQPNGAEKDQIKQFEAAYDAAIAPNTEAQAIAGLKFLDGLAPKPLFFANHPARRGLDSPHEIRNWKAAAPDVAMGFEGAPGHQAAGMIRDAQGRFVAYRGFYGNSPTSASFPGYPPESFFTYGGFDWMTATLGGLWDSLLGDGLRWWITANSDAHKYWNDLQDTDAGAFSTNGFVTEADRYFLRPSNGDFRPGEYSRTYVVTADPTYAGVMAALRGGQVFVVHGDLIDRLRFTAEWVDGGVTHVATMGETLQVPKGKTIRIRISLRVPSTPNWNNQRPVVDHVDLITGLLNNPSQWTGPDTFTHPRVHVLRTFEGRTKDRQDDSGGLVMTFEEDLVIWEDKFLRLRGTNTGDRGATPRMDPDLRGQSGPGESPWDDLWFYSNPIFVRVQR